MPINRNKIAALAKRISDMQRSKENDDIAKAIIERVKNEKAAREMYEGRKTGEQPLQDEHPGLDLALMYAQPGNLLAKALAPSMAKGMVSGLLNGEGAQALLANIGPITYNGTLLRRAPDIADLTRDASAPYRGRNFVHHGVPSSYVSDVLHGESRTMTPSLGINRVADYNDILNTPFPYGDYEFIGDKSMLEDALIFRGDAMSPVVGEPGTLFGDYIATHPGQYGVPSNMREAVAEDLWLRTIDGPLKATGPRIKSIDELEYLPMNTADGYFEAIHHGTLPYEKFKYVITEEPGVHLFPTGLTKNQEEDILNWMSSNGLKVKTFDPRYKPYRGYDGRAEAILDIVTDPNSGVLFDKGGSIHIKPSKRGTFTAAASKHGKSVQAFASQVLAHKENYSPAMVKKANFARNAAKWHGDGGPLEEEYAYDIMPAVVKPEPVRVNLYTDPITKKTPITHSWIKAGPMSGNDHGFFVSKDSGDPGYNLLLANCSDATGEVLEMLSGQDFTSGITTPYGVRRQAREVFSGYPGYNETNPGFRQTSEQSFYVPWYDYRKAKDVVDAKQLEVNLEQARRNGASAEQLDKIRDRWNSDHQPLSYYLDDAGNVRRYAEGGLKDAPETEYANKWDRISNSRYTMAYNALVRSGSENAEADRLARFLAAQSALESGWVDESAGNNYAGYLNGGKRMSFDTADTFWDYHVKNLDNKWPGWRDAQTIDDYYNTVNSTALGLTTKDAFTEYNKNHRDAPAYIYAPDWENENYLGKLKSVYSKYISKYVPSLFDAGGFIRKYGADAIRDVLVRRAKTNKYDGDSKETGQMQRSPEGGYTTSKEKREEINKSWDPTTGFGPFGWLYSTASGNQSHGEENEYWRAYLGLDNNVPKMSPAAKTGWDDAIEAQKIADGGLTSDFYGTTPRMDQMIQVVADTLNTGNILRNYDSYKAANPELAPKGVIKHLYEQGKRVMENPDAWTQVKEGPQLYLYDELDASTNEKMPLGMLANFGMMWSPSEGALRVHDTYDFPGYVTTLSSIPKRPKEMKIRGLVKYDPKKGSVLLRDGLDKSKQAKPVAMKGSH